MESDSKDNLQLVVDVELLEQEVQLKMAEDHLAQQEIEKGEDHLDVAEDLVKLGHLYREAGQFKRATTALARAVSIKEHHYGSAHVEVAIALIYLAKAFRRASQPDKAIPHLERAAMIYQLVSGSKSIPYLETVYQLARVHREIGQRKKAIELHDSIIATLEETKSDSELLIDALMECSACHRELHHLPTAVIKLDRARAVALQEYGSHSHQLVNPLMALIRVYKQMGKLEDAIAICKSLVTLAEKLWKEDPQTASGFVNLGALLAVNGDYDKAVQAYEHARSLLEVTLGSAHTEVASLLCTIGDLHREQHKKDLANSCYTRALEICQLKGLPEEHHIAQHARQMMKSPPASPKNGRRSTSPPSTKAEEHHDRKPKLRLSKSFRHSHRKDHDDDLARSPPTSPTVETPHHEEEHPKDKSLKKMFSLSFLSHRQKERSRSGVEVAM